MVWDFQGGEGGDHILRQVIKEEGCIWKGLLNPGPTCTQEMLGRGLAHRVGDLKKIGQAG